MPKGVEKKSNNKKSKSRAVNTENNNQSKPNTQDEKDIAGKITNGKSNKKSSKKQQDLATFMDHLTDESDINKIDESDKEEKPLEKEPKIDLNYFIDDVRDSIKESTLSNSASQVLPGSAHQKNDRFPNFFEKIDNWMYGKVRNPFTSYRHVTGSAKRKRSPLRIIFLILILVFLGYIMVNAGKKLNQIPPVIEPTYTPVPTYSIPVPYSVQFPGGWTFSLGTSSKAYPDWKPVQAEWFKDTDNL